MPRQAYLVQKLNNGELSPLLDGFVGLDRYPGGCKILENMLPLAQGPVTRRPPSRFVWPQKSMSQRAWLVPFEFSTVQAYMLEFGDQYIRFYKDKALITLTPQSITGITKANPAVVTYAGADNYSNGKKIKIAAVAGMHQVNNREFTVANVNAGANTFELSGINSSAYGTYVSGGEVAEIYEIASPYTQADLFDADGRCRLRFAQSNDVLYLAHPLYHPRTLSRSGHTNWTMAEFANQGGPSLGLNDTASQLAPSATTGSVTIELTVSSLGVNGGIGFRAGDVGRLVRIKNGSPAIWGTAKITAFTDATHVTASVLNAFGGTGASPTFQMGLWNGVDGYPAAVAFHEDRLCWAGAGGAPQRVDMSMSGAYTDYYPFDNTGSVLDDSAVARVISSGQANGIRDLVSSRSLLINTVGSEFAGGANSTAAPIAPDNFKATPQTKHGSANVAAVSVGNGVLMLQRQGRRLRRQSFSLEQDSFVAADMSLLGGHTAKGGIMAMAYQQEPNSVVWAPRADGQVPTFTYQPDEQVLAWARQKFGGAFGSGGAVVESAAVIPGAGQDQVWITVKRTIDSATVRYVEVLDDVPDEDADQADMFYGDSCLSYDGAPTDEVTGAWHLNGQQVVILADGAVHPRRTVANGRVELDGDYSTVHLGLPYRWTVQPMRFVVQGNIGTAEGDKRRIDAATLRFYRSGGVKIGRDLDHLLDVPFRKTSAPMDAPPPLKTGAVTVPFNGVYDLDGDMLLSGDDPLPVTITQMIPKQSANAG